MLAKDSGKYKAFTTEYGKWKFIRVLHVTPGYFAFRISETLKGLTFEVLHTWTSLHYSQNQKKSI